jgi:hypothetical protein
MILNIIKDYKANVPLSMISNKYGIPIHEIVQLLYRVTVSYPAEINMTKKILKEIEECR